jgi:ferredoxin-NADP reductase
MVHKGIRIELVVKELRQDNPECKSVVFERPIGFNYDAGDWIDVDFADTSYKGGKTYSLSSSPTGSELRMSFRVGISPFKKKLQSVQTGDKMYISQYGNDYGFHLKDNRSSVLIAGGIGIAPFRSMLKEMFDLRHNIEVSLIYLNQNDNFLFKDELDLWSKQLTNLSISYISTKNINRKKREKLLLSLIKNQNQNFYISGPPGMVESNEHLLIEYGANVRDIRIDSFGGYE